MGGELRLFQPHLSKPERYPGLVRQFGSGYFPLNFCFPPSTEQEWFVQPGPPRFGRRHPIKKNQTTTAITNNQTQFISISFEDLQYGEEHSPCR